jgi:hypothetical protein
MHWGHHVRLWIDAAASSGLAMTPMRVRAATPEAPLTCITPEAIARTAAWHAAGSCGKGIDAGALLSWCTGRCHDARGAVSPSRASDHCYAAPVAACIPRCTIMSVQ